MANNPRHLRPNLIFIDDVLNYYAESKKDAVTVIQVGANDGKHNDPIHKYITKYKWDGVLVEPQEVVFKNELRKTYENYPQIKLENCAIAQDSGELPFYRLSFTNSRWATGLATFHKPSLEEQIRRGYVERKAKEHGDKLPTNIDDYIETTSVKTESFDGLTEKYQLKKVDFLCIDTEGFDYHVLKLFNFDRFQPEVILFESKNIPDDEYIKAKELLAKFDYQLYWFKGDTLALRTKIPLGLKMKAKIKAILKKL